MDTTASTPAGRADDGDDKAVTAVLSYEGLVVILVVGAGLMCIVCMALMVLLVKKCCLRSSRDSLLQMEADYGCCVTKSAPSTRNSSPRLPVKRLNGNGGRGKVVLMRSLTADMIPDFDLPAEPVQPLGVNAKTPTTGGKTDLGPVSPCMSPELPCDGQLYFSLLYINQQLTVNLIKAKGLPPRSTQNPSRNPYVKVYLLPDVSTCYESNIQKKTLAPRFEEKFVFKVHQDELRQCELRISVYDLDQRRTRHSLGYVRVPLADADLTSDIVLCKDLTLNTDHG